jgi:pilus assembly protein CpaF
VAPPIAAGATDAPWRTPRTETETETESVESAEAEHPAVADASEEPDEAPPADDAPEVQHRRWDDDELETYTPPAPTEDAPVAGFKPWESPMSSGFESAFESLTAALNEPESDEEAMVVAAVDDGGPDDADAVVVPFDDAVARGVDDPVEADAVADEAAPAALPLASPAFARSKFGAMKRDEGSSNGNGSSKKNGSNGHNGKDAHGDDVDEGEEETAPPRISVFAPSVAPADGPRATSYGLGDKSVPDAPVDPLAGLKKRVEEALLRRIGSKLAEGDMSEEELRGFVERELGVALAGERSALSSSEREQIVVRLTDDLLGHGPMEQFLKDESVTEIMVSGLEPMYVERAGRLELTDVRFGSESQLRQVIERIVGRVGRRIDESSPMVDARLPDGSRVNAIIPPLAVDGPALTIRKFSQRALTVDDLIKTGSLSQNAADMMSACVRGRLNILVTGGTGSGKTTMLNILSSFIPNDQRIVTIEDAVELRLSQHHVIRLEARPPNIEGRGAIPIRELVRNSLRMRPDRIIVGEVRAGEALDMLQAMNTGHDGSLSTLHANTPRDVLARLETMVLMAGFDLPVRAIREQIASAVDVIVHISRLRDGTRRVTHIVEVEGMEGEIITLTDLYLFDYSAGIDDDGRFKGDLKATGLRPKFSERLADLGVEVPLPSRGFDPNGEIAVGAGFGWNR